MNVGQDFGRNLSQPRGSNSTIVPHVRMKPWKRICRDNKGSLWGVSPLLIVSYSSTAPHRSLRFAPGNNISRGVVRLNKQRLGMLTFLLLDRRVHFAYRSDIIE